MIVSGKPVEEQTSNVHKRYALRDIIGGIEGDLFKSALSVHPLVHEPARSKREFTTLPSVVLQKTSIEPTQNPKDIPTKVSISRVIVYKAPASSLFPQIPTFSFLKSTTEETVEAEGSGEEETTTLEATTVLDEEVETTTKSTTSSTTTTSSTSTTTTTTTTKAPIVELKEAEEEIQEKIAEVAADPIIFSSRV